MTAPHWMKWQKPLVDAAQYRWSVERMICEIKARPVIFGIEVGVGWGISADLFLKLHKDAILIGVDIEPELEAIKMLHALYPGRFIYWDARVTFDFLRGEAQWLYIDAGHEYEEVKADIAQYEKFLMPGGVLAFDDYGTTPKDQWHYPGVKQAVDEFFAANADRYGLIYQPGDLAPTKPLCAVKVSR